MDFEWVKLQFANGAGKSRSGLAAFLGIPNSAVTAMLKGDRQIKLKEVPLIREYFQMDTDGGLDTAERPTEGILEIDTRAGLGGGGTADHQEVRHDGDYADPVKAESWRFPNSFMRQELRASENQVVILETDGDSMEPTIGSGERIIVHTGMRTPSPDGIFALRDTFGNIIAKRLQVLRKGDPPRVLVISDNKAHSTEEVGLDEISIVGRVLWGLKRL